MASAQKENGPAEAATSPSRGSNRPYEENAVNEQHRTTAPDDPASVTRRQAFKSLASGAAMGLTGAVIVATTSCVPEPVPAAERDPLLDLIEAYERGLEAYGAVPDEEFDRRSGDGSIQAETYGPHYAAILASAPAATSEEGAIRALRCMVKEMSEGGDEDFAVSIGRAVLAFLEGRAS